MRRPARLVGLVLAVLAAAFLGRDHRAKTLAASSETITWGATDPTWSPDGKTLAFSLFGSIWQVPAQGGEALQITVSPGYHAHPAWSPTGRQIAFLKGKSPQNRLPYVPGTLMLADLETHEEREIRTPGMVNGTLAWSPDGARIACALAVNGPAALLHEITVADKSVRPIQRLPQDATDPSPWIDTAWDPKNGEVYFAAQRSGVAQVWSMAPAGPPIAIQLPLTHYRPEDIAELHSVSAMPDGSGVVFSADIVNGPGNYELYRVPRRGGEPVNLTLTARDEFAPSVSPDGKRIAFVSNRMDNIDLFTMPIAGGAQRHVPITGLRFRQPSGRLRVKIFDEMGNPTRVRLYVEASDGKAYCPAGSPIFFYFLEPGKSREGFFVASGDDTFPVPAGKVRLTALKGIEYDIADRTVEAAPDQTSEITIQMRRWTNWSQRGWYTGDNHFHANYNGSYYQRPADSLAWLEAEDLNAANMVVANSDGAFIHDQEYFRGKPDLVSKPTRVLFWGEEYRNSYPYGHLAFLNIRTLVPPFFTSVPGSKAPYDFPMNTTAALQARNQGGLVTAVHPIVDARDVFDMNLGAKEAPVTAALGALDAIDLLPFGESAYELWYRFLNCGFRIAPGAGTDVFTNWRPIHFLPGGAREYVEVGSSMDWARWVTRLREGRDFVTNGPLLAFTVNGEPMGTVVRVPRGQTYRARLAAEVTSRVPLRLVEFIRSGTVIARQELAPGVYSARLEREEPVQSSCWFAVRVSGYPARGVAGAGSIPRAHSGAIYVNVGEKPTLVRADLELMLRWLDRLWALLEARNNFGPGENRTQARQMIEQARKHFAEKLKAT